MILPIETNKVTTINKTVLPLKIEDNSSQIIKDSVKNRYSEDTVKLIKDSYENSNISTFIFEDSTTKSLIDHYNISNELLVKFKKNSFKTNRYDLIDGCYFENLNKPETYNLSKFFHETIADTNLLNCYNNYKINMINTLFPRDIIEKISNSVTHPTKIIGDKYIDSYLTNYSTVKEIQGDKIPFRFNPSFPKENYEDLANYVANVLSEPPYYLESYMRLIHTSPEHLCHILSYLSFAFMPTYMDSINFLLQLTTIPNTYYSIYNTILQKALAKIPSNVILTREANPNLNYSSEIYTGYREYRDWFKNILVHPVTKKILGITSIISTTVGSAFALKNYNNTIRARNSNLLLSKEYYSLIKFYTGSAMYKLGQITGQAGVSYFKGFTDILKNKKF